eukprot:CAMPEP_0170592132 /NCGR_PEP_ID=MMETSP0224-20130122/12768_1 /TAXON_ID=285029 /ORGANISM="Togula jolla, Strain CCCM 725" /LENGTH=353 /DNA_ID=CAMNT_0010916031 /DNA_START=164 /DNA_END=1225 /DNA_ORIENTATION=-
MNFSRSYKRGTDEYEMRRALFESRMALIEAHNAVPGRRWTAGISHLLDKTDEEFSRLHGWRPTGGNSRRASGGVAAASLVSLHSDSIELPDEVSWSHLGAMTEPLDQGGCGSCWAVATSVMLDGRYEVRTNTRRTFSAQQLVNCVPNPRECGGTGGCHGATVELAMDYIVSKGLKNRTSRPYYGQDMECTPEDSLRAIGQALVSQEEEANDEITAQIKGYQTLPSNQARPLMESLLGGPVAISAAASDWMFYESGIFDSCSRDAVVNHAVVLVGYGGQPGSKYWTVQNSWGPSWGERGFIRVFRQDTPEEESAFCGTDDRPEDGIECKPYPESVQVCGMCAILYDSVVPTFKA